MVLVIVVQFIVRSANAGNPNERRERVVVAGNRKIG